MISAPVESCATSATRSVPVAWSARVITTSPPKSVTASAIRRSSVATMMRPSDFARRAASTTCWISGRPVSERRGLPGSRVEAYRAGITPTISMFPTNILRETVRYMGHRSRPCPGRQRGHRALTLDRLMMGHKTEWDPRDRSAPTACGALAGRPRDRGSRCDRRRIGAAGRPARRHGSAGMIPAGLLQEVRSESPSSGAEAGRDVRARSPPRTADDSPRPGRAPGGAGRVFARI